MTKKTLRIIAAVMLVIAAAFIVFALTHPDAVFPWSNTVSYIIYGVYAAIMIVLFIAPVKKR